MTSLKLQRNSAVLLGTLRMRHLPNDLSAAELAFLAIPASAQNTLIPTVSTLTSITGTLIPISAGCSHSHQHTPLFRVSARPATHAASGERAARRIGRTGLFSTLCSLARLVRTAPCPRGARGRLSSARRSARTCHRQRRQHHIAPHLLPTARSHHRTPPHPSAPRRTA